VVLAYPGDVTFTALHRAVGAPPDPVTDELLDAAVAVGTGETSDLDWKEELPPAKRLPQTDFPKDVAAMANSGGGVIVFGVREVQKAATERLDVGDLDEGHERALRGAAVTAISPPVFGLTVHKLGAAGRRAVVVEVLPSVEVPHLIYRGEYFGAPVRNDADTVWMKERQVEAMFRARFEERRHATEALDALMDEASAGRDVEKRAWLIAVAHPRLPKVLHQRDRAEARAVLSEAAELALTYAGRGGIHPFESVDRMNPRPGLRRWVAVNAATGEREVWRESWAALHHDGSVTVTAAVGGHRKGSGSFFDGREVEASAIECAVADFMALVRTAAEAGESSDYDLRVAVAWAGADPLMILTTDNLGYVFDGVSTPLHRFTPVETTVDPREPPLDYYWRVHDLARDCVNQGGISNLQLIHPPARDGDA